MKTKVLLINAPTIKTRPVGEDNYFPIGLLYIATMLKNNGIDVGILDINNYFYAKELDENILSRYLENNFYKALKDYKPDIIGIGCTFSGAFKSLKMIAKKTKELFPKVPVVIGGIHPTVFSEEILNKYDFIDYVVIGEGEASFLALVKYITSGSPIVDFINGVAFRDKRNIRINPKTKFEDNLDRLPHPDYSIIDVNDYKMNTSNWYSPKKMKINQPFTIISSRSCPNRCTFCSMWLVHGPKIRFRSSGSVLDEMEYLYTNYNVRYFQFMDDNMTFDRKRTLEICDGIRKRNMSIQFDTPNGLAISRLDKEIIDAMIAAGLVKVSLGIESGSEYIRNKIMKKGLSTKKIYDILDVCAKHKHLFIKGFFIIGVPQETTETLNETYEMIKKSPFDKITVGFASPYPGTELFKYCFQHNMLRYKTEEYVDVEVFQDSDITPHFKPENITMDELITFRRKCYNFIDEKRRNLNLPDNYSLRFG